MASEVPHPPNDEVEEEDLIENLGLLVPNVELSTGCSPAHLPGNPPSGLAQSLTWRVQSLFHTSNLIRPQDLQIQYTEPRSEELGPDEESSTVTKAHWTLYIDILCISLDGNAFDAAWTAVMAALQNTSLPKAWWDPDAESIMCSPLASEAHRLAINSRPMTTSFAVFSTASPLKQRSVAASWTLADPDGFEEDICREALTVVVDQGKVLKIEKHGGPRLGRDEIKTCARLAVDQWQSWTKLLASG